MTYGLTTTPRGVEAKLSAATRDEFYRDAVTATLEAQGDYDGSVVPIQATGDDDIGILRDLVSDCLTAVSDARGTLHPPRWLSFDTGRVTANLPATSPASTIRPVASASVLPVAHPTAAYEARILFELGAAH